MVGRDRVAEDGEAAGILQVGDLTGLERHAVEVGRPAHVGRALIPAEQLALGDGQCPPAIVAGQDITVDVDEHLPVDR